jgi:hypothetical protein
VGPGQLVAADPGLARSSSANATNAAGDRAWGIFTHPHSGNGYFIVMRSKMDIVGQIAHCRARRKIDLEDLMILKTVACLVP